MENTDARFAPFHLRPSAPFCATRSSTSTRTPTSWWRRRLPEGGRISCWVTSGAWEQKVRKRKRGQIFVSFVVLLCRNDQSATDFLVRWLRYFRAPIVDGDGVRLWIQIPVHPHNWRPSVEVLKVGGEKKNNFMVNADCVPLSHIPGSFKIGPLLLNVDLQIKI